jgi:hypothetical protein
VRARRPRPAPVAAAQPPLTPLRAGLRLLFGAIAGTLMAAPILLSGSESEQTLRLVLGGAVVVVCTGLTWRFGAALWDAVSTLYSFTGH